MSQNLREALAAQAHVSWSGWMKYMISKSCVDLDGTITIPKDMVMRWTRQMNTPYDQLSEKEKESDRVEADHYLQVLLDQLGQ